MDAAERAPAADPLLAGVGFVALAGMPRPELERLVARTSAHLAVPCRIVELGAPLVGREIPGRGQLDAAHLVHELAAAAEARHEVLVGLTARDLAIPIFTHVFGYATVGGWAAVVSLARLAPEFYGLEADPELLARRAVAEIIHELGHVGGLGHCRDASCVMHFAAQVEAIDLRGSRPCVPCRATLGVGLFVPHVEP